MWSLIGLVLVCLKLIGVDGVASLRPSQVVQVSAGKIQGKTYTFEDGQEATAFLGIQYGKPPIGSLRFKKSLPAEPWSDVKNVSQFGNRCFYYIPGSFPVQPSEDCLYLNVFAPGSKFNQKNQNNKLLPIALYIHGGGFQTGSPVSMGDESIARYWNSKDLIVVTINYRLQFLGFLALDEETPGNLGLWDMKLALEWTRRNARVFGGDPNQITVFGQSAGAFATDQLTLSPHTRNLFQKSIMFAGNDYNFFAVNKIETLRAYAKKFAIGIGFQVNQSWTYQEETAALLAFFQNAPPENITIGYLPSTENNALIMNSPSLDGDFFSRPMGQLRKEAPKKEVIAGVTQYEGLLFLAGRSTTLYPTIYDYAKFYLTTYYAPSKGRMNSFTADIILQTFVNMSLPVDSNEFYTQCVVAISDFLFNYPTYKMLNVRVNEKHETVYLYNFTYFNPATIPSFSPFVAPTHTLELPYVFGHSLLVPSFVPNEQDVAKLEVFVGALTNFVKNGKPSNTWKPYNPRTNNFYWFGQNTTEDRVVNNFGDGRMQKWDKLYKKLGLELSR